VFSGVTCVNKEWRILILYASYGAGHYQVSRVLAQGFAEKGINHIRLLDLFAEAHPRIDAITQYIYRKSFSFASSLLYGWTYYSTRDMRHDSWLSQWFHSFGAQKLRSVIEHEQPDIVINTFPMLVMPILRKKEGVMIPTVTVLTDFALHNRWVHQAIDRFYVPTKDLKNDLKMRGIHPNKILVTGIPIKKDFECSQRVYSPLLYKKWGLDPSKKLVLVMAGAYGRPVLQKICQSFLTREQFELLVICGNNQVLQGEIKQDFIHSNIHFVGFVEEIDQLMKIAACILTKAGGITLSEALAMNLPIILLQPVPGQERENARYLTGKGAAITVNHIEETAEQISSLLQNEPLLLKIQKITKSLHHTNVTETIIQDILRVLSNRRSHLC
jgi:processive 1,2-diacylglycerol beta-glucosyltransferase